MNVDEKARVVNFAEEVCKVAYALDGLHAMADAVKDRPGFYASHIVEAYRPAIERVRAMMETASDLVVDLRGNPGASEPEA